MLSFRYEGNSELELTIAADHFQTRKEWDYHPIKKFPFLAALMKPSAQYTRTTYENNGVT